MAPATRKVSGARSTSGGRQVTLSFNHRVTKVSASKQSAKEAAFFGAEKAEKATKKEKPRSEEAKAEAETPEDAQLAREEEASTKEEPAVPAAKIEPPVRSQSEIKATAVSQAQIRRYWQGIEAQRTARRVHQTGLDLGEKVLRYFDVSSQFGPCVGISRKKRWMRAQRLGLEPPIEVLAVLLREEDKGVEGVEQALIDRILNPPVIV